MTKSLTICLITIMFSLQVKAESSSVKNKGSKSVLDELRIEEGNENANEVKSLKAELLISKSETQAIGQLRKLLRKYKGTPLEAGLWFRMAEMYMRRSKTAKFFELHRQEGGLVDLAPKKIRNASSRKYVQKAINTYNKIEKRFPRYRDMDLVFFNNAYANQLLGRVSTSQKYYKKVIKGFPQSFLVPDSYLAVAELHFENKNFAKALENYNEIRAFPDSKVFPYALYKSGWSLYNLQKTAEALSRLEEVVAHAKRISPEEHNSKFFLRSEALNDMVLFYSEVHTPTDSFKYFRKQAGDYDVGRLILKLAHLYNHHGKYKSVSLVLNDYIDEIPYSKERPLAHKDLIYNYELLKNRQASVREMKRMRDEVCYKDVFWKRTRESMVKAGDAQDPPVKLPIMEEQKQECISDLAVASRKMAKKWHKYWTKYEKKPLMAQVAEDAYEIYLEVGLDKEKVEEARYTFSELLFNLKKYRKASLHYAIIGKETKNNKFKHDAGYAAIVSLEKAVNDKWNEEDEAKFVELAGVYIARNPKGKYVDGVQFKKGLIAYEKKRYSEAEKDFFKLAESAKNKNIKLKAQDLYLDILNIEKRYTDLKTYSSTILKSRKLNKDRRAALEKIYRESYFSEIQKLEEDGKVEEAIAAYKSFALENKKTELAPKAWWNGMALLEKKRDLLGVANWSYDYFKTFPHKVDRKEAILRAAEVYEEMGQITLAKKVIKDILNLNVKDQEKWILILGDYARIQGHFNESYNYYEKLLSSKDDKIVESSFDRLVTLAKSSGNDNKMYKIMKLGAKSHVPSVSAQSDIYNIEKLFERGKLTEAFNEAKKVLGIANRLGLSPSIKARARFIQAQILRGEFERQSMKSRPDRVAMVLGLKTEKLEKSQKAYQSVINYGDPELLVEGLIHLSEMYGHYSKAVRGITFTGVKVSEEDLRAFQSEVEKLAIPMEEKQVETLSQALEQAKRFEVRDGKVLKIQSMINKLNMRKTNLAFEIEEPQVTLPMMAGGKL